MPDLGLSSCHSLYPVRVRGAQHKASTVTWESVLLSLGVVSVGLFGSSGLSHNLGTEDKPHLFSFH